MRLLIQFGFIFVFLFFVVFMLGSTAPWHVLGVSGKQVAAILMAQDMQSDLLFCLLFCGGALVFFETFLKSGISRRLACANAFLAALVIASALSYWRKADAGHQSILLFATIVLGKIASVWVYAKDEGKLMRWRLLCFENVLILLFVVAVFWPENRENQFYYLQLERWKGPWDNPNLYGILMGCGAILLIGILEFSRTRKKSQSAERKMIVRHASMLVVLIICVVALYKSYSRGAWAGTVCGVYYLVLGRVKKVDFKLGGTSYLRCKWHLVPIVLFSIMVFGFWQFRFAEWRPVRRAYSVININDFSWRNRATAWEGAVRMMAERPWNGFGWGNAESVYNEKYSPPNLKDGAAIQMNDYFMLGISAGVPALICFLVYVGFSLRSPQSTIHNPQFVRVPNLVREANGFKDLEWLQTTCRAGAIVLLVGFFFDGGLFKLVTGSVFWILLELGRVNVHRGGTKVQGVAGANTERLLGSLVPPERERLVGSLALPVEIPSAGSAPTEGFVESGAQGTDALHRRMRWEIWLRRSAWILGISAFSESAILLSTPFFGVNNTTLAISRHYLIPPSAVADLNLLATNVDWSSRKLRPLLQHASLANYNRQLINWKLDDEIYRGYVLNPSIAPVCDGQLVWRRKLWEYFYLPIRKENDPLSAAQIVLRFLYQRIAAVPVGPATIDEMWQEKRADQRGIQALEVAAFRSVGIPARLNESGRAELFSEGKWQAAPE